MFILKVIAGIALVLFMGYLVIIGLCDYLQKNWK